VRCEGGQDSKTPKQGDTETVRRAWRRYKQERRKRKREQKENERRNNHEQETEERQKDNRK
jgi:hypothetical protein